MPAPRYSLGLGSLLGALVIILALGVGTVYAAIPSRSGSVYACYVKNTGALRLINYPKVKTCPAGQKLIKWSATGPQGPLGPQGAQGPQGPKGDPGPADWNAIGNKPPGFADGVDDIGPSYTSEVDWTLNWPAGYQSPLDVSHPAGVDVLVSLIPAADCTWDFAQLGVGRTGATVYQRWHVKNTSAVLCLSRVRVIVFGDGITPASLKKALKKVRVTVADKKGGIRVEAR